MAWEHAGRMVQDFLHAGCKLVAAGLDAGRQVFAMQSQRIFREIALVGRHPADHSFGNLLGVRRPGNDLLLRHFPLAQLDHEEIVGIAQNVGLCKRTELPDQPVIPVGVGLVEVTLGPHADDGDRHLMAKQRVRIELPIELVHLPQMEFRLVEGLAAHRVMKIAQSQLRQLTRRDRQDTGLGIGA